MSPLIPAGTWTPIALQMHGDHVWRELEGAPMSVAAANAMVSGGTLFMAQRRDSDCTALVVMAAKARAA